MHSCMRQSSCIVATSPACTVAAKSSNVDISERDWPWMHTSTKQRARNRRACVAFAMLHESEDVSPSNGSDLDRVSEFAELYFEYSWAPKQHCWEKAAPENERVVLIPENDSASEVFVPPLFKDPPLRFDVWGGESSSSFTQTTVFDPEANCQKEVIAFFTNAFFAHAAEHFCCLKALLLGIRDQRGQRVWTHAQAPQAIIHIVAIAHAARNLASRAPRKGSKYLKSGFENVCG